MNVRQFFSGLAGQMYTGDRDMHTLLGYKSAPDAEVYADYYRRHDIAARIVDAYPDACWSTPPEQPGIIPDRLWHSLHTLDRLAGVGEYGVLLIGLDGGEPLHTPTTGMDYRLLYLRPHSQRTAKVKRWDTNPASPRYGLPDSYNVDLSNGSTSTTSEVHHSRVIHVAERSGSNPALGEPRLQKVLNRLDDLQKLLGGGSEIYWKSAAPLYNFKIPADMQFEDGEAEKLKDQLQELTHGLTRSIRTRGVDAELLSQSSMIDPTGLIDKQLDFVAGATGIPKRILVGSESGELASSQDQTNWGQRVAEREAQFCGPEILAPTLTRLMQLGCIPRFEVNLDWPEDDAIGTEKKADIALKKAQALAAYTGALGGDMIVQPEEFRSWLALDGDGMADLSDLDGPEY